MGNQAPVKDTQLPGILPLPCDDAAHWAAVQGLAAKPAIEDLSQLQERVSGYHGDPFVWQAVDRILGMEDSSKFFGQTLPFIIQLALQLPDLRSKLPNGELPILRQGVRRQLRLSRDLVASLLANMFLCTFDKVYEQLPGNEAMPSPSFRGLHVDMCGPELAKLHMFFHYFQRLAEEGCAPRGEIIIDRVVGVALTEDAWLQSSKPLLAMEMAPMRQGFEKAPKLAHADFANMFIGGGVLCGGCVQEEIRFAICPELCASMLVCPCMLEEEAIQILGGEQFSAYKGYGTSLQYGGDHRDPAERLEDGTVLVSILAMDALDYRGRDSSLDAQLSASDLLRDLNKSLAAFAPVDEISHERFPKVATGNWGCGAFGGCAPLKALVQWASASQCGRQLRYFPFEQDFGPELQVLAAKGAEKGLTVGALLSAVWELQRQSAENMEKLKLEEPANADGLPIKKRSRPPDFAEPQETLEAWTVFSEVAKRLDIS